jgi:hypothetical protein
MGLERCESPHKGIPLIVMARHYEPPALQAASRCRFPQDDRLRTLARMDEPRSGSAQPLLLPTKVQGPAKLIAPLRGRRVHLPALPKDERGAEESPR